MFNLCVYIVHYVYLVLEVRRQHQIPRTRGNCSELPYKCWELNPGALYKSSKHS